jgi:hypothetical protein
MPSTFTAVNLNDCGPGSLRQAVLDANALPGPDDILVARGLKGTVTLRSGPLNITDDLTITGPGDEDLAVSGNRQSRVFRVDFGVSVTLSGLTITQGDPGGQGAGGVLSYGTLTLDGCTVTDNSAAQGGGIFNADFNALTLVNTRVTRNSATQSTYGGGGGIYNDRGTVTLVDSEVADNFSACDGGGIAGERGTLTLQGSQVWGNRANGRGGGIFHDAEFTGTITLSQGSTVNGNAALTGGGIYNLVGTLTVCGGSAVVSNTADTEGGGIYNPGTSTALITDSTVASNRAAAGGGIMNTFSGQLALERSTVADNEATEGGGVWNSVSGQVTLTDSTVSGNTAEEGGGLFTFGQVTLRSVTVADNAAARGGGVWISSVDPPVSLINTVVAANQAWEECADLLGNIDSQGHNLIGDPAGGSGFDGTDLLQVDPMLGPLQDNGGPTQTHALLPGSPAIDAGDNTGAPDWDQRGEGFPRIVNGVIDIGAYEVQAGEGLSRAGTRSRLPPPLLEGLMGVAPGLGLSLPELEELGVLPAPPGFRGPLAHHVLVLARLQHLTGDGGADDHLAAHAARLAVVVDEPVAAGHALQEVLVADLPLADQDTGQFQGFLGRFPVVFGGPFIFHGLFS